jgi:dTDP-4-dehydrorhamnose 3,5-epimerase
MHVVALEIPDVKLITPRIHRDRRGFFSETYHQEELRKAGIDAVFVQDNHTLSRKTGVVRGLHFQTIPHAQGKLVRVPRGAVFDVAVDLRRSSATFGRWVGQVLSDENHRQMWVPVGFAHGFLVLSEAALVAYKCTEFYNPLDDRALRWNDPALGIAWPLPEGADPILSPKDAAAPLLSAAETYP